MPTLELTKQDDRTRTATGVSVQNHAKRELADAEVGAISGGGNINNPPPVTPPPVVTTPGMGS